MTYTKKLIEIEIKGLDGSIYKLTDTAEDSKASLALAEIKRGGTLFMHDEDTDVVLPASAVAFVDIKYLEDAEVEKDDPCMSQQ